MSDLDADDALRDEVTTGREGLPPSYRMRADAHYVDQLTRRSPDVPMRLIAVDDIDEPRTASPADRGDLRPLVKSIAEHGVVQPLLVLKDGSRYRLISGRNRLAAARAASVAHVPCLVHQVDEVQAEVLARATQVRPAGTNVAPPLAPATSRAHADTATRVSEAVTAIRGAAAMLAGDVSPMARRVALDLVRAEAWRAAWQLRASAILEQVHAWSLRPQPLGYLVRRACDELSSECRLRTIDLKVNLVNGDVFGDLDEEGLICGVTGAVIAIAGLGAADAPQLTVTVRRWSADALAVEVAQPGVSPGAGVAGRFFDRTWSDRPGGWAAALGAAVAQAVAERHGGEAAFLTDARGSTLRLTIDQSANPTRQ